MHIYNDKTTNLVVPSFDRSFGGGRACQAVEPSRPPGGAAAHPGAWQARCTIRRRCQAPGRFGQWGPGAGRNGHEAARWRAQPGRRNTGSGRRRRARARIGHRGRSVSICYCASFFARCRTSGTDFRCRRQPRRICSPPCTGPSPSMIAHWHVWWVALSPGSFAARLRCIWRNPA